MDTRPHDADDDTIDLSELFARLRRGLLATLGLSALGLVLAAVAFFIASPLQQARTSSRVVFSFDGFERGEYPDGSKFQADDLRAPEVVLSALREQGLETTEQKQTEIRSALTIEGIIPDSIVKGRDRLRAAGQTPPPFQPDEFLLTLTLPRKFPMDTRQRELLLTRIVNAYRENFTQSYASVPLDFGSAFDVLSGADYFEYELILNTEIQNILSYLQQQQDIAHSFRSRTTNFTFGDLLKQTERFTQIKLNGMLGLIRQNGLSKNRALAMVKMDYYLRSLEDRELRARNEETVILDLLAKTQQRGDGYVLGVKSQAAQTRPDSPVLDQGLIDSLLANDAYNFLVRKALDAGLRLKDVQAEKAVLLERKQTMESFLNEEAKDQSAIVDSVQNSLSVVEDAYRELIKSIRVTHEDFAQQQYADAVRLSMQAETGSFYVGLAKAAIAGLSVGMAVGVGISLLGIFPFNRPTN
jgi:hypothetical protein